MPRSDWPTDATDCHRSGMAMGVGARRCLARPGPRMPRMPRIGDGDAAVGLAHGCHGCDGLPQIGDGDGGRGEALPRPSWPTDATDCHRSGMAMGVGARRCLARPGPRMRRIATDRGWRWGRARRCLARPAHGCDGLPQIGDGDGARRCLARPGPRMRRIATDRGWRWG